MRTSLKTGYRQLHLSPDLKLRHNRPRRPLDTPFIIKGEPNTAQRRVRSTIPDRTWSLSHLLAVAWGNEQMHRHQKCAHSSRLIRHMDISNRIDCVSRFESKPFLKNILESNAGGRGNPPPGMASVSVSTCAHSSGLNPARDSANRTDSVRSPDLSPFEDIFWPKMGGGGGGYHLPTGRFRRRPIAYRLY